MTVREEDRHRYPDEAWERYFAERAARRARRCRGCSTCVHEGQCDSYCGGSFWSPSEASDA